MLSLQSITSGEDLKRGFVCCLETLVSWHMTCGAVYFSVDRLAAECGYKARWMRYALKALEAVGLVERDARPGRTNLYRLVGRAAEYVRQRRDARARDAAAKAFEWQRYLQRCLRAASNVTGGTPALNAANLSSDNKKREESGLPPVRTTYRSAFFRKVDAGLVVLRCGDV